MVVAVVVTREMEMEAAMQAVAQQQQQRGGAGACEQVVPRAAAVARFEAA